MTRRITDDSDYGGLLPKALPHNADAERAILGAIILDNSLVYQASELGLESLHFYIRANQIIFGAMLMMAERGAEINPILLGEELRRLGLLEQVGGVTFLSELTYGLPHFTNLSWYTKVVIDKSNLRALVRTCSMISTWAINEEDEAREILTNAESTMLEVTSLALRGNKRLRAREFVHINEDKPDFLQSLENVHKGISTALPTGIRAIDAKLDGGGLNPQGLYLIAAKPKAGKTSLALGIGYRTAKSFAAQGIQASVGIISLEMRRLALETRLYSAHVGVPYDVLTRPGRLFGANYAVALEGIDSFFKLPMFITDAIFTIPEFWRAGERLVFGPTQAKLLIVDYLQLMSAATRRKMLSVEHRVQEVTAISREIKHMAQEFNIPILGISSLSRLGELRESGQIDYDVEALLMLENPKWRKDMTTEERAALDAEPVWDINARLAYQRNGPTGDIMLKFLREFMDFMTIEEYEQMLRARNQLPHSTTKDDEEDDEALWRATE